MHLGKEKGCFSGKGGLNILFNYESFFVSGRFFYYFLYEFFLDSTPFFPFPCFERYEGGGARFFLLGQITESWWRWADLDLGMRRRWGWRSLYLCVVMGT